MDISLFLQKTENGKQKTDFRSYNYWDRDEPQGWLTALTAVLWLALFLWLTCSAHCADASSPLPPVSGSPCLRVPPSPPLPVPVPCTVLDPFSGAGTTALVAAKLGRDAIGIELKPEYMNMAANRLRQSLGMLASVEIKPPEEPPGPSQKTENRKQKTGF